MHRLKAANLDAIYLTHFGRFEDVATAVAMDLKADKLLCLVEGEGLLDEAGHVVRELSPAQAERVLAVITSYSIHYTKLYDGEVRRVDTAAIHRILAEGAVALLSPIGYSPTGEVFIV